MYELLGILITAVLGVIIAFISVYQLPGSRGKKIFKAILVLNLLISIGLITYKFFNDRNAAEANIRALSTLRQQNDSILVNSYVMIQKQDTLRSLFEKVGIRLDFQNPDVYLNVNSNFKNFITTITNNNLQQSVKLTEVLSLAEFKGSVKMRPDTTPPTPQDVTRISMEQGVCMDKTLDRQFAQVCFVNQTGQDIRMVGYTGYAGWVTNEQLPLPDKQVNCTARLAVNSLTGDSKQFDFSFYFTLKDGTEIKAPYRLTIESCYKYTIVLTRSNLGL